MSAPDWPAALLQKAGPIRLVVFDIDGVMTDGRLFRDDNGHEIKAFHSRDGLGMKALIRHGFTLAALTARHSKLVRVRMAELGIEHLVQGREDKGEAFEELLQQTAIDASRAAYMGDDLVDWPAMRRAELKLCPGDGDSWVRRQADYVTAAGGGRGAVREVCELLLEANGWLDAWRNSFR
ncbi:MAG: HAD hydrolase family protein [Wenzhouxiangellaceae bacterium]|nr:HAD hydrolase family protein [Wenzhouxiangellaceae bacterium]